MDITTKATSEENEDQFYMVIYECICLCFCMYICGCLIKSINSYIFNISLVIFRSYNFIIITLRLLYNVTFCICNLIVTVSY